MASERARRNRDVKRIDQEFQVTSLGLRRLEIDAGRDPTILGKDLEFSTIGVAIKNLNATYAIRVFADFETSLRDYWVGTKTVPEPSRIAEIIDRVGSERKMTATVLRNAHRVRDYRNRQVHDNEEPGEMLSVAECRSFLGIYLARMPLNWTSARR